MKKEPNWFPGIQKQQPFARGVEPDNPRHLTRAQAKRGKEKPDPSQAELPMDTGYLKPQICPECRGIGRERKGRACKACGGEGIIPADPYSAPPVTVEGEASGAEV